MQHRTVEKSAALGAAKIVLGAATATNAPTSAYREAASVAEPSPAARIAELGAQLATARSRAAQLEAEIGMARTAADEANAELEKLRAGIAAAHTAAEERGYAEGSAMAKVESQAAMDDALADWQRGIEELAKQQRDAIARLQLAAGDIALAATTKVIGERLADAAHVRLAVEHIVRASGLAGKLKISLAPSHFEALAQGGTALQRLAGHDVELQADERVAYGGCLLEAADVSVDGRYEIQLQKLQLLIAEYDAAEAAAQAAAASEAPAS